MADARPPGIRPQAEPPPVEAPLGQRFNRVLKENIMKKLAIAAIALAGSVDAALANCGIGVQCPNVPEISALEGTAALAALAAVVLLAWERSRRSA